MAEETLKREAEETLTTEEPKKWFEAIKVSGSGKSLETTGREEERAAPPHWRREQGPAAKNHRRRGSQTAKKRAGVQEDGGEKTDVTGRLLPLLSGAGMLSVARKPGSPGSSNKKILLSQFATQRQRLQSRFRHFHSVFYGLLNRQMCKTSPADLGKCSVCVCVVSD